MRDPARRGICVVCREKKAVQMHHVIPKSKGGKSSERVPICDECHGKIHRKGPGRDKPKGRKKTDAPAKEHNVRTHSAVKVDIPAAWAEELRRARERTVQYLNKLIKNNEQKV